MAEKGFNFDRLLQLDEDTIRALFPYGAIESKERYKPAAEGQEPAKTLKELLKAKEKRVEKPRLLARNSARGYVTSSYMALGVKKDQGPTLDDPPEPEAVPKVTERQFTKETKERETKTLASEGMMALLKEQKALKSQLAANIAVARRRGINIRSDVRVIERRLEAIKRKLLESAA